MGRYCRVDYKHYLSNVAIEYLNNDAKLCDK